MTEVGKRLASISCVWALIEPKVSMEIRLRRRGTDEERPELP